jgi:predicted nucleic acid-binding protein
MKIIVDANIVFSAIFNSKGKIGEILINSNSKIEFIAPNFLKTEIAKHFQKICKISGLTELQIIEISQIIYKNINFINEELILPSVWDEAFILTQNIDPKDTPYIAYALHFNCLIWSGDLALINRLHKYGFDNFINTSVLLELNKNL